MQECKNLGIGEMLISRDDLVITTILGSCVSVCLFSLKAQAGGIIHYALPDRSQATNSNRSNLNFGDLAIRELYEGLLKMPGVSAQDIKAKIVGGGNVLEDHPNTPKIGDLNIEMARSVLKSLKIEVVGENVGGKEGRKLYFYPQNGRLRVSKNEAKTEVFKKKRVLVVDDSKIIRDILSRILNSDSIEVVGLAISAEQAEPMIRKLKPDVITLDVHMPGMDGVTFLEKYLPEFPIPTIMISSININESDMILKALEFGAVDYIEKPKLDEIASQAEIIREKVFTASTIKVKVAKNIQKKFQSKITSHHKTFDKIVAMGASTGGTEALKQVLIRLPANIPPIVIVQHIPPIFSAAFAKRLNELCPFEVKEAEDGDLVIAGRVLIAAGATQMELQRMGSTLKVRVFDGEKVNRHKPSVDVLFNSAAKLLGRDCIGVIMTGMGEDGAQGLLRMREAGSFTIGQDEESCVVYGMPKAAADRKAVVHVCSLDDIPQAIMTALEKGKVA